MMHAKCENCDVLGINGSRCHERGCSNANKQIQLISDGSLDTVLQCAKCNEEFRFNFDPEMCTCEDDPAECSECYENFVSEMYSETECEHECYECRICGYRTSADECCTD